MIANVFFATTILFLALFFFLLEQCAFLIPYRMLLIDKYCTEIAIFAAACSSISLPACTSPPANSF